VLSHVFGHHYGDVHEAALEERSRAVGEFLFGTEPRVRRAKRLLHRLPVEQDLMTLRVHAEALGLEVHLDHLADGRVVVDRQDAYAHVVSRSGSVAGPV
jgi:hypothetical protein